MRAASVFVTFGVLGVVACSRAAAPAHQAQAPRPVQQDTSRAATGRQPAPEATGLKPYNQVITAGATTDAGIFIVHQSGEKLFYEIPKAMFGREFLAPCGCRTSHRSS